MIPQVLIHQFVKALKPIEDRIETEIKEKFKFERIFLSVPEIGSPTFEFFGKTSVESCYYGLDYGLVHLLFYLNPNITPIQNNGNPAYWLDASWLKNRYGVSLFHAPYDPLTLEWVDPKNLPTTFNSSGDKICKMLSGSTSPFVDTITDITEGVDFNPLSKGVEWNPYRGVFLVSEPQLNWISRWREHAAKYENRNYHLRYEIEKLERRPFLERLPNYGVSDQLSKLKEELLGKRKIKRKLKIDPLVDPPLLWRLNVS